MSGRDNYKSIARDGAGALAASVLAVAERLLRPADQLDYVIRRWLIPVTFEEGIRSMPHKGLRFGASVYRAIFKRQSGSSSVHSTPLSDLCPRGSPIFSENLSNEAMSPRQSPESVMLARH